MRRCLIWGCCLLLLGARLPAQQAEPVRAEAAKAADKAGKPAEAKAAETKPAAKAPEGAPAVKAAEAAPEPPKVPDKKDTLSSLLTTRESIRKALEEQRQKLRADAGETVKQEAQQQIELLEKRRQEVERDFNVLVTGLQSLEDFNRKPGGEPQIKLQDEISQLLTPIFSDMRELTRKPREVRALQEELGRLAAQEEQARRALAEVDRLLAEVKASKNADASLRTALTDTRKQWQGRLDEAASRAAGTRHRLAELRVSGADFWSELGHQVQRFVFVRGTNIALALIAFLVVLFGLRAIYCYALKLVPVRKYQRLSFTARVLDVAHEGGSLVLAIITALLVLYARGDWLLGGLSLLALGGLLMTAKTGIAKHLEELQYLLNLGSVREGERVHIDGVPWRVGSIHMFTQLTNQLIGGPGLRLPLEKLTALTSRPSMLDEPWFPCSKRSWVLLGGGTLAQVLDITPDYVELRYAGGLKRWLPLGEFMKADVASLAGGFARSTVLGLDYRHQALALAEIPDRLREAVRAALLETMREEELLDVTVEFQEAAASSLNFLIAAQFAGSQAPNYLALPRLLQRAALEACNRHGWSIPFPQLVVHRAE